MKKVLVTGSSGLIGSEVVEGFSADGWHVHGVDNNMRADFSGHKAIHVGIEIVFGRVILHSIIMSRTSGIAWESWNLFARSGRTPSFTPRHSQVMTSPRAGHLTISMSTRLAR